VTPNHSILRTAASFGWTVEAAAADRLRYAYKRGEMINRKINFMSALMSLPLALMLLSFASCTYYMPVAVSSTSIGNQGEIPVKVVSGSSEASYFLVFGPFGDDSLLAALEDARSKGDGDTLANVFVDRKVFCIPFCGFPLYTSVETRITGTLVKYQDERSERFRNALSGQNSISYSGGGSRINLVAEEAYGQMLAAFGKDALTAESAHNSFSSKTKNDLKDFVLTKRGRFSATSWKIALPENIPEVEKRFLHWFLKTYTDYKPAE